MVRTKAVEAPSSLAGYRKSPIELSGGLRLTARVPGC